MMKENLQFLESKNNELIRNAKKADEPISLSEELNLLVNTFDCKTCEKVFETNKSLKCHMKSKDGCNEKKIMKENEIQLDIQINFQKLQMTEKSLELNFRETYANDTCKCKGNCKINHSNYNWKKINGQELYSKILNVKKHRSK